MPIFLVQAAPLLGAGACCGALRSAAGGDPAQAARFEAGALYEKFFCARSDMENRIKEQQLDL